MSDPMQNLNDAADALNQVAARAATFWDDADARVAAKEAEVDAFLAAGKTPFLSPNVLVFNRATLHSKATFTAVADPAEASQSVWYQVPSLESASYVDGDENDYAALSLVKAYSSAPGYYDNPQYGNDWSRTTLNFVMAPYTTTSDDINTRLGELGVALENIGVWGPNAVAKKIPILRPLSHPIFAHRLWVRFRNVSMVVGNDPQEITTYGDPTSFAVDRVQIHRF